MTNDNEPPEELRRRRIQGFKKWLSERKNEWEFDQWLDEVKAAAWEEGWRAGNDHGSRMYTAFSRQLDDMDTSVNSLEANPYRRNHAGR